MKNVIVKKDFIDVSILKTVNDDLLNNLKVFLEKGTHLGGGKIDFMNNWFEDNLFGKIMENIYMYFPAIRSIKRILASLIKEKNLST